MKWRFAGLLVIAGLMGFSSPSMAGPYGDDLTKCFIEASGTEGQTLFIQWLFVAMGENPAVKQYVAATPDQKTAVDKQLAGLVQRLLTETCRDKAVAALKYEGFQAYLSAFEALGQAAARTIMSGPQTTAAMTAYVAYMDADKVASVFKDAGLPAPQLKAPGKP